MVYCDYIADRIKRLMDWETGRVEWDLDPNGAFVSTKKTLTVKDPSGKIYKVTVEEM